MKKKSYLYIFVPIIALVAFSAYYWSFIGSYEAKQEAEAARKKKIHDDEIIAQNAQRLKVVQEAIANQEKQKKEREAKAAKVRQETEAMETAQQARKKAQDDAQKLKEQVDVVKKDIALVKEEIGKTEGNIRSISNELDFVKSYDSKATMSVKSLTDVLEKIDAADRAAAAAAKAAAAAAAKK
jgi:chromosome segregation ATPase